MPIGDKEIQLRATSAGNLTATGNGSGVDVGPAPLGEDLMVRIYAPLGGTTVTLNLAESDASGGTYVDLDAGPWTFTAAGTYLRRVWWKQRWLRWECTAITGDFGAVTIDLVPGGKPN